MSVLVATTSWQASGWVGQAMSDGRSANAVDTRLGQRVRARRLEIGMSQERLAELLGVTFQQVQKYEKGVNRMAAGRLFDIAAALNIPVSRFFEGLRPKGQQTVADTGQDFIHDAMATPEGAQLMSLFAGIKSAKLRRNVVHLVGALVDETTRGA